MSRPGGQLRLTTASGVVFEVQSAVSPVTLERRVSVKMKGTAEEVVGKRKEW